MTEDSQKLLRAEKWGGAGNVRGHLQQGAPPMAPYVFRDIVSNPFVIQVTKRVLGSGVTGPVLLTLAERRTRYSVIAKAPDKSAQAVTDALLTALQPQADLVHTLTHDNGKEFAYHQTVAEGLEAQGYFAHPCHSWERGLNENTNGLIRQYLPKGADFRTLTLEQVRNIMDRLNNRPRKCLGFKTPNQLFSGINPPVALTS